MEKFKEKIRIRILSMSAVIVCLAIAYFVLLINRNYLSQVPDFIRSFQMGAFAGIVLLLVFFIARDLASMRNEETLKKLYIEENDERTVMIMQKTGAMGMTICIIGLAFGAVIAGFFNQTVFFSLMGAAVFTALVKGFFKLYYHFKL